MIIQCEKCQTKFNLDDSLLKKEGSKVRCSLCTHIFVAFPPEQVLAEEPETVLVKPGEPAALAQDVPPALHEEPFQDHTLAKAQEEPKKDEVPPSALFTEERRKKSHALSITAVIILILLGASAAVFFWAPELIPDYFKFLKPAEKKELADTGVRRLSFEGVTGSFVKSKLAGDLFVIGGKVVNNYPKSRSFILINGSILDEKGEVVKKKLAYAGNSLKKEEIKAMSLEEISKAMKNRYGRNGENFNVAPGATVPFTIVFENLPENLSEFTVEAVSSSPGT